MSKDSYNIRDIQNVELTILTKFAEICDRHNLKYFLDSGTALGAIRHEGFIPWDDDIDVGMPRDDYEKFLEIGQKELGDQFFLQNVRTDKNTPFLFSKIRKNNTTFLEWNKRNIDMHHGIYIDIFPYDYLPKNEEDAKKYINDCIKLNQKFLNMTIPDRAMQPQKSLKWIALAVVRRCIYYSSNIFSKEKLIGKCQQVFTQFNHDDEKKSDVLFSPVFCGDYRFPENIMFPPQKVKFENQQFNVPCDHDTYLKTLYGDYMKLPDEKDRVGHRPAKVELGE